MHDSGCTYQEKVFRGSVKLRITMTMDTQWIIIVFVICSSGLFSRKRITLCEEKQSMELRIDKQSRFEFSRSDIERHMGVHLPDSYTAQCRTLLPSSSTKRIIQVKGNNTFDICPAEFSINKNDINDFDGLLCASNIDFVPEIRATCKLVSTSVHMQEGISGVLTVDHCNMEIQSISVGIVQNEILKVRNTQRTLQVVRDTTEIACGNSYRNQGIPFLFFPNYEGISNDYEIGNSKIGFSLRVKVLFRNQFYCIKYLPVHFTW